MLRDLLDPRQIQLTRLRLVVLSACQSAISDFDTQREEAVGLFGALLAGGVPGVIGTLWPVNDLATAALMEAYGRRYLVEGQAPDLALRGAARELRGVPERSANPAEQESEHAKQGAATTTSVEADFLPTQTPALRRWEELAARDPEGVIATRLLSPSELTGIGQDIQAFRMIPRDHPIYWAAFVFYGAAQPLDGDTILDASTTAWANAGGEEMGDDDMTLTAGSD
jgi:CHAT domain-containing protein